MSHSATTTTASVRAEAHRGSAAAAATAPTPTSSAITADAAENGNHLKMSGRKIAGDALDEVHADAHADARELAARDGRDREPERGLHRQRERCRARTARAG